MNAPLLICRDCKWCHYPGEKGSPCFHEEAAKPTVDYVTGAERPPLIACVPMRANLYAPCGIEARLFEPREAG